MHFPGNRGSVSGPGEGEPRQRGDALLPRLRQGETGDYTICQYNIQHLNITIPQYQEDPDIGFPASLSCSLLVTLLLGGLQVNTEL